MGSGQGEGVRASRDEMATGTRWGDARWSSTILDANDAAGTTFLSRSCDDITTLDARPPNCYQIMSCLGLPAFWLWLLRCAGINKTRCTARFLPQTLCDAICRASSLSAIRCRTSSLTLLGNTTTGPFPLARSLIPNYFYHFLFNSSSSFRRSPFVPLQHGYLTVSVPLISRVAARQSLGT
jgi:hypothetical protein